MAESTIRYIVQLASKSGRMRFARSFGGAAGMYQDLSIAKRKALNVGDKIYKLDLSSLGTGCPVIGYELVFTRGKKEAKKSTLNQEVLDERFSYKEMA